jgi:transposase-like protein
MGTQYGGGPRPKPKPKVFTCKSCGYKLPDKFEERKKHKCFDWWKAEGKRIRRAITQRHNRNKKVARKELMKERQKVIKKVKS